MANIYADFLDLKTRLINRLNTVLNLNPTTINELLRLIRDINEKPKQSAIKYQQFMHTYEDVSQKINTHEIQLDETIQGCIEIINKANEVKENYILIKDELNRLKSLHGNVYLENTGSLKSLALKSLQNRMEQDPSLTLTREQAITANQVVRQLLHEDEELGPEFQIPRTERRRRNRSKKSKSTRRNRS